jgi:flagellar protein FliL
MENIKITMAYKKSRRSAARQIQSLATIDPAKLSALAVPGKVALTIPNVTLPTRAQVPALGFSTAPMQRIKMASKPRPAEAAEAAEGADGAPAKRKFPLKLIIIVVGALVVLGGGGAAAFLFFGHSKKAEPVAPVAKPATFFDVPEVLVNLSSAGGDRTQYLKVKVVLELADSSITSHVQAVMPRVMDAFQTYMRELRPTDLDGSAGLYRLKEELTRRVNMAIAPQRVNAVLFKEIVVQ